MSRIFAHKSTLTEPFWFRTIDKTNSKKPTIVFLVSSSLLSSYCVFTEKFCHPLPWRILPEKLEMHIYLYTYIYICLHVLGFGIYVRGYASVKKQLIEFAWWQLLTIYTWFIQPIWVLLHRRRFPFQYNTCPTRDRALSVRSSFIFKCSWQPPTPRAQPRCWCHPLIAIWCHAASRQTRDARSITNKYLTKDKREMVHYIKKLQTGCNKRRIPWDGISVRLSKHSVSK